MNYTKYILEDDDSNTYMCSECEEEWTLSCGTPKENNMKFCPFCGLEIKY